MTPILSAVLTFPVDMSWTAWIWNNIAPDERVRRGLAGPRTVERRARRGTGIPSGEPRGGRSWSEWRRPFVMREVTDEKEYESARLAR